MLSSLLLTSFLLTLPQPKPENTTPDSPAEVSADFSKQIADLEAKAAKGDGEAAFELSKWYADDEATRDKSLEWVKKAAELNYPEAQFAMGYFLTNGLGFPKDERQGFEYYLKAANQGNPAAQASVGDEYLLGGLVKKDEKEALRWYQLSAKQDFATAVNNIGTFYLNGQGGLPKDSQKAMEWHVRAAFLNSPMAQNTVGVNYAAGYGVEKNLPEAFAWMWIAASGDDPNAQENILHLAKEITYEQFLQAQKRIQKIVALQKEGKQEPPIGPRPSVNDDQAGQKLAEEFQTQLSKAQKGDVQAQYQVAQAYALGKGVKQSFKEAFPWCQKAAESGLAEAQFSLAQTYRIGDDFVQPNLPEAVRWYKKAAEQKNIESLYALGIIYDSGDGVEKDEAKSLAYNREAADLGHAQAQHNLAVYYFSRADKEPSSRELIFKYFTLAAKQMHARSMMALGVSYFVMETSPNKVEGLAWMMAAVQCFAYKMDLVDKFRDQESPEDVAKARERATQIISQIMKQK